MTTGRVPSEHNFRNALTSSLHTFTADQFDSIIYLSL
jgi:hypothetical protein